MTTSPTIRPPSVPLPRNAALAIASLADCQRAIEHAQRRTSMRSPESLYYVSMLQRIMVVLFL